ncbi:enoyl-CoA hydratase/isomerase family protein [Engelhardtia mirabilis]|uniref:Putative enoyl-CoA hydratase n=1 Tax=Engelhardtia mirabilis TaxID=2528011 RepID=A0A518BQP4_9BACT|nr:putative enoyl-CoA hydratase [Planctomycetes bacterium Pla133]QDV03624.1 putative enoyl-CoA hydratase [Planctomycetes bacterium Pla86]
MPQPSDLSAPETLANGRVRYQSGGGVALFTLTCPPANGYSFEMMRDLDEAILRARFDREVEVIIVCGEGEKFFCAGADISMLERAEPNFKYYFCLHANETLLRFEHTPKLVIAALGGHCVGGGLEIALACDLRVARKGSGKCGLPEVALGVLPGTGGTQRMARMLPRSKAIELMASGERFDFDRAEALGLVDRQIEAQSEEEFLAAVFEYAGQFMNPAHSSASVGHIKRAVQGGADLPLEQGLALERELQAKLFSGPDAKEGLAAFMGKRAPHFEGGTAW